MRNREATNKQLSAQLQYFAALCTAHTPDSFTQLVSDDDRAAWAGDEVEKAVKAVERVATAAQKMRQAYEQRVEETKKRQAQSVPVDSTKRKKHRAHLAPTQPAVDGGVTETNDTAELLPAYDAAHIDTLLSTASSVAALYALSVSLFEWSNGPLITAMQSGELLLLDEISLADDAVLERLNSVLEPERSLLLAEKGDNSATVITAHLAFHVFGTMNPGGDFGKKELSPALRNRMTEVWVEGVERRDDLLEIVQQRMSGCGSNESEAAEWSDKLVTFVWWYNATQTNRKRQLSLRDVLAWVAFVVHLCRRDGRAMLMEEAYLHGACLTLLDGLGIGSSDSEQQVGELKRRCVERIIQQTHNGRQQHYKTSLFPLQCSPAGSDDQLSSLAPVVSTDTQFGIEPFLIRRGPLPAVSVQYSFSSPTPHSNLQRVLRALHLPRAVLLEGSPGVGKCFARGTRLRLFDGRQCAVEDVEAGMELMGDDGCKRIASFGSLTRGKAPMYSITPQWEGAEAFTVNGAHILVLINTIEPAVVRHKSNFGGDCWLVEWYELDDWDNVMRLRQRPCIVEEAARVECGKLCVDWQPLEWEVSVDDFLSARVKAKVRSACHLLASPAITFHAPDQHSLEQRLTALIGWHATSEQVDCVAWLIGLWLSGGLGGMSSVRCAVADTERGLRLSARLRHCSQLLRDPLVLRPDHCGSPFFTFSTATNNSLVYHLVDSYGLLGRCRPASWEQSVLCENITVRRTMLAGCMDGCGLFDGESGEIVLSLLSESSARDVKLLAASLGLRSGLVKQQQPQDTFAVAVAGDLEAVTQQSLTLSLPTTIHKPQQPSRITYPFSIAAGKEAEYFGFAVEGGVNRRFLLADFTVTHNSSLIQSLAAASSHPLTRIQLSEQTDMMDLLGVDLPVEGEKPGTFRWSDGVFLQAMKAGHWVLLDELNLASQSVLEGLNAVLDHRSEMYIPELNQTVHPPPSFRVFAAQNPMAQGGGRRGLPASFLNRFTKVQLDVLSREDLLCVGRAVWSGVRAGLMERMVSFNQLVYEDVVVRGDYGKKGGPWEFNLRDIGRWCDLIDRQRTLPAATAAQTVEAATHVERMNDDGEDEQEEETASVGRFVDLVYLQRMRTREDRTAIMTRYQQVFGQPLDIDRYPPFSISSTWLRIGDCFLSRVTDAPLPPTAELSLLHSSNSALYQLAQCVEMRYPALLIGESSSGKSSLVHTLAALTGHPLAVIDVNESMDSSDLLGCFEQIDIGRHTKQLITDTAECVRTVTSHLLAVRDNREESDVSVKVEPKIEVVDGKGKRKLEAKDGKRNKKQKHGVNGSTTTPHLEATLATGAPALSTVSSLYAQLEACLQQRRSSEAEQAARSTAVSFSKEQHAVLSILLQQLHSLVTSNAIALPAHLAPSFLLTHLDRLLALSISPAAVLGTFQWLDGSLLHALEYGHWLLMENINYCSASVLDRLNGLLERGGVLMVNECGLRDGQVRVVRPHPNFRLFGTMNEQYGQVSRAMRNRCVEIVLLDAIGQKPPTPADTVAVVADSPTEELVVPSTAVDVVERDLIVLCNAYGVSGSSIPSFLVSLHHHVCRSYQRTMVSVLPPPTVRHLQQWCALLSQQLYSGASGLLSETLTLTFRHAYPMAQLSNDRTLQSAFISSFNSLLARSRESSTLSSPWLWPAPMSLLSPLSSARSWSMDRSVALLRYLADEGSEIGTTLDPANHILAVTESEASSAALDVTLPSLTRPASALSLAQRRVLPVISALVPSFTISSHSAHPLPSVPQLFRHALLHFVAHSSPADWQDRAALLRHLTAQPALSSEVQRGVHVLNSLHQHPVVPSLKERQQLASATTLALDYVSAQPLIAPLYPRRAVLLLGVQQRRQLALQACLIPFVVTSLYRAVVESEAYQAVDSGQLSVTARSPIQQSYAHYNKQEHARHDLLIPLYPLFAQHIDPTLQQLFTAFVSSPTAVTPALLLRLQALVERRNWLWDTLHLPQLQKRTSDGRLVLDDEAIRIRWSNMQKAVESLRAVLPAELSDQLSDSLTGLSTYLASLDALLAGSATAARVAGKNVLYKRAGHPLLPRSQQLGELQHELLVVDQRLQWSSTEVDAFWLADDAVKQTLLEALCNIRYIVYQSAEQQSSGDVERLTAQLSQLPQRLSERLDTLTAEAAKRHSREHYSVQLLSGDEDSLEEMGLNDFQRSDGEAEGKEGEDALPAGLLLDVRTERSTSKRGRATLQELLPITDMFAVVSQRDVVACMSVLVCLLFTQQAAASELLRSDVASQTVLSSLSSRLLAQLPSLVSFSSSYTTASPTSLAPFQSSQWLLERLEPVMTSPEGTGSWPSDVSALLSALPSLLADVLYAHFHFLHRSSFSSSSSTSGSAALLTPRLSSFVTSLISRASSVSLIDRHTKRMQVSLLVDAIVDHTTTQQTYTRDGVEGQRQERLVAVSQLALMIACYRKYFSADDFSVVVSFSQLALLSAVSGNAALMLSIPPLALLAEALARCKDARLTSLVSSHWLPAWELGSSSSLSPLQLARLSLLTSLIRLLLYLPASPVDTSRAHLLALTDTHYHWSALLQRMQYKQWADSTTTGALIVDEQWALMALDTSEKEAYMRRVRAKVTVRRAGAQPFANLYEELHRFAEHFDRSLHGLQAKAEHVTLDERSQLQSECRHQEEQAGNFVSQLQLLFSHYSDVIEPIIASVLQAKDAIARLVHLTLNESNWQSTEQQQAVQTLQALLSFPLPSSAAFDSSLTASASLHSLWSLLRVPVLNSFDRLCQEAVRALKQRQHPQSSDSFTASTAIDASSFSSSRALLLLTVLSRAMLMYAQQRTFASSSPDSSLYTLFDVLFSTFVDCWQQEKEEQRRQDEAAAQLYKYEEREVVQLTEQEQDELTRKELYPDFSGEWADMEQPERVVMDEEEEERDIAEKEKAEAERKRLEEAPVSAMHLSPEHLMQVYNAFTTIFSTSTRLRATEQQLIGSYSSGYRAATTLLSALQLSSSTSMSALPASLDREALVGHLFMLATSHHNLNTLEAADTDAWIERERSRQQQLTAQSVDNDEVATAATLTKRQQRRKAEREQRRAEIAAMPDVWKEANVEELRRLEPTLLTLALRVRTILNEYPRQEMCLQLLRIVHRLSALPSSSPVMQLLSGVEVLLRKAEEWDKYASRDVSLKAETMRLRALVVRWRKMELYTWPKALKTVEDKYQLSGMNAFFHLWSVLHIRPDWQPDSLEERDYLRSLYQTLQGFMRHQCKLGEFEARLDLIATFAQHIAAGLTARQHDHELYLYHLHARLHTLLTSLHQYYSTLLPLISAVIQHMAAPLHQQLTDQAKLARWDLSNYEQLRESSEKNHKRLVSISRKYEEVLAMNVGQVLDREEAKKEKEKAVHFGRAGKEMEKVRKQHTVYQQKLEKRRQKLEALGAKSADDAVEEGISLSAALFVSPPIASLYFVDANTAAASSSYVPIGAKSGRTLLQRLQSKLSSSLLGDAYINLRAYSGASVEGFTVSVIDRISELQTSEANKHRKAKALVDVRKSLEGLGLRYTEDELKKLRQSNTASHSAATRTANLTDTLTSELLAVPELFEQQPLSSVFSLPPSSTASAAGFFLSDTYAVLRVLGEQCDEYTWKVVALLATMRVKVNQHHTDLSAGEVRKGKGMLEYLTQLVANLRGDIGQVAREMQGVGHWLDSIQLLAQPPASITVESDSVGTTAGADNHLFWQHKHLLDSLITALDYYRCLYIRLDQALDTSSAMHDQLSHAQGTVQSLLAEVQTLKAEMDMEAERVYPSLLSYGQKPHSQEVLALRHTEWSGLLQRHGVQLSALWTQHKAMQLPFVQHSEGLCRLFLSVTQSAQHDAAHGEQMSEEEAARLQRRVDASLHKVVTNIQEWVLAVSEISQVQKDEPQQDMEASDSTELALADEFAHHTSAMSVRRSNGVKQSKRTQPALFQQLRASLDAHLHNVARLAQQPNTAAAFSTGLTSLHSLVPALQQCTLVAQRTITSALAFLRSSTKLDYVLLSSFNTLLTHGFCGKDTEQDKQDSGMTDEGVEGTGMGEGEGEKDVSDQLQEEQQLEGLREEKDEAAEQQQDKKGEEEKSKEEMEKGMEMEQEFEGEMHDMPDDDEQKEGEDEDDDKEKDELDREMVDEDDKQQVVDERLWNDSDEEEEDQRDRTKEKQEKGDDVRGHEDQMESIAKDEENEQQTGEAKQDARDKQGEEENKKEADADKDKDEVDVEEQAEEGGVNDNEEDREEDDHNIEPFQLPDDVKLDDEEEKGASEEKEQAEGEAEGKEEEEGMEDGAELTDEERKQLEGEFSDEKEGGEEEGEQKLEEDKQNEQKMENDQAEVDDAEDRIAAAESDKKEEETKEGDEEKEEEAEEEPRSDDRPVDQQLDEQQALGEQREEGGAKGGGGQQAEDNKEQREQREEKQQVEQDSVEEKDEAEEVGASNADDAHQGQESEWRPAATNTQPQQEQQQQQQKQKKRKQAVKANPYKSLGDALKQWQERLRLLEQDDTQQQLDDTAGADDVQQLDDTANKEMTGAVENVDKQDKADAQMLGPVEEKEERLEFPKEEKAEEERKQEEERAEAADDDMDMKEADEEEKEGESEREERSKDRSKTAARPTSQLTAGEKEQTAGEEDDEDEVELLDKDEDEMDDKKDEEADEKQSTIGPVALDPDSATPLSLLPPPSDELLRRLRAELDGELQSASPSDARAAHMWQHLVSLTSSLSHQLCETLRMVLEPTLANRLRGDYKTGKRLNLKKIIPYIASHFRRDKIWLRRAQASQRTYQVLLAIDDSLSMQRAGGGRMALEATATITQALSQLEVGEVAVVKYGDSLQMLHPFDRQWTDDSGRYAVSQFSFKQTTTRWPTVLQQLMQLMGAASDGRSSSGTDCLQLCFLISDGQIQQDRDEVRHWTREAQRRHILLVLIIVDTGERSITSTSRYVGGATGKAGKGGLMFESYLDTFPFPYYLVLRQIEQLPHVLADALRQWFEIVQQTNADS